MPQARAEARRRAGLGDPAQRAEEITNGERAAVVIRESTGIPPHLSLPPFDTRLLIYLMTTNERRRTSDEGDEGR